jgi:hypothetical protein
VEGFICQIEWLGLTCNWISNYRGVGVKSVKELDYELVSAKVRGLIAKCQGKLITGQIIFLKKTLWTDSTGLWTKGGGAGPWWTRLHTPSRLLIMTLDFGFDGQEQIGEWAAVYGSATKRMRRWGLLEPVGTVLW